MCVSKGCGESSVLLEQRLCHESGQRQLSGSLPHHPPSSLPPLQGSLEQVSLSLSLSLFFSIAPLHLLPLSLCHIVFLYLSLLLLLWFTICRIAPSRHATPRGAAKIEMGFYPRDAARRDGAMRHIVNLALLLLPSLLRSLPYSHSLRRTIHGLIYNAVKTFMDMNQKMFEICNAKYEEQLKQ